MSRFDRINTAITQIPIPSAAKVFNFIDELFENRLDKEYFKQDFWNFDTGEQYFICYYLNIYFDSSDRYTFFNNWLKQKEDLYRQAGDEESFIDFKEELYANKQELLAILNSYKKTAERRFKTLLKHKVPFDLYSDYFTKGQIDYKIPLHYKPKEFKTYFLKKMSGLMTTHDTETFFYNSFDFGHNLYPVKLLNIELDNHTDIKERIIDVKTFYDSQRKYQLEKSLQAYNGNLVSLPKEKQPWHPRIEPEFPTLCDFAKIIYNAFPQIRDKALGKDLNQFLKNYGKNLVKRK